MSQRKTNLQTSQESGLVLARTLVLDYLSNRAPLCLPQKYLRLIEKPVVIVSLDENSAVGHCLEEVSRVTLTNPDPPTPRLPTAVRHFLGMEGEDWKTAVDEAQKRVTLRGMALQRFNQIENPAPVLRRHLGHCVGLVENIVLFCDLDSGMGTMEIIFEILTKHLCSVTAQFLPRRVAVAVFHDHPHFRFGVQLLSQLILKTEGLYDVVWSQVETGGIAELSDYRRHKLLQHRIGRDKKSRFMRHFIADNDEDDEEE